MPRFKTNTVYVVQTGSDFAPVNPWDLPKTFTAGEIHARGALGRVIPVVKEFNAARLAEKALGKWSGQWAVLVRYLRPRVLPATLVARTKGGAACEQ